MAENLPDSYPVKVEKTVDGDKVVRTVHSVIALRQAQTEGFKLAGAEKKSAAPKVTKKSQPKKADDESAK